MKTKVELDNSNISKHLGQSSAYAAEYDPTLLVREPRQSNRTHLDISLLDFQTIKFLRRYLL
jgi:NADPH-dependent 7-cyano-7-deazaguanine reductase QueF-like protein